MIFQVAIRAQREADVIAAVKEMYPLPPEYSGRAQEWIEKILKDYLIEVYTAGKTIINARNNKPDQNL
jgi:hypothetical protein